MPRYRKPERLFTIGDHWIERVANSPSYYRATYDKAARQVRRRTLETEDFEEAKDRLIEWWTLNHRPRDAEPERVEIVTVLLQYYDDHGQHVHDPARIRLAITHLSDYFRGLSISDLTAGAQKAYGRHREAQGVTAGTWGRELSVARAACRWAAREGMVKHVPEFEKLSKGRGRERILGSDEFRDLLRASEAHCRMAILCMAHTCGRPSAVLDLTVFQCDRERRLINLNPPGRQQTKKHRPIVPMTDGFLRLLDETEGPYLVQWRGRRVASIKKAFARARERAGLSADVIPYTIRHTMRTEMARQGVPDSEADAFMGHAKPGTGGLYTHMRPDYLVNAVRVIDGFMGRVLRDERKVREA